MGNTKRRGDWGEDAALRYLEQRGYSALARGYRTRFGEIDLIVTDGKYIVFVEVKMRRDREFAEAREFVSAAKQRRVRTTAEIWLMANETELQPRFDVIEVYAPLGTHTQFPEIVHLDDAF